jgi:hypothetical protein
MAIEVPCTLRCDRCGHVENVVAETRHVRIGPDCESDTVQAFVVTDKVMPEGWRVAYGALQCPRCNGVK